MFESTIIDYIASSPINSYLSSYMGRPSIFSGQAPEEVDFPYVIVLIKSEIPVDSIITRFKIDIDVYHFNTTEKIVKEIIHEIRKELDNTRLNSDRFKDIRIRRDTYFKINVPDPRGILYRLEFTARATRTDWIKSI